MAERREPSEYSSPPKRIKLDPSLDDTSSVSTEALACGDSGFSELTSSALTDDSAAPCQAGPSGLSAARPDESMEKPAEEDKDDCSSTVSDISDISGLSMLSGQDWKPVVGPMSWVQRQMQMGTNPRLVLARLGDLGNHIPDNLDDTTLWKIIVSVLSELPRREKLSHVNTVMDVVRLLRGAHKILVLTGAGVSVSCGIPDFRSRDGIYSRLAIDFPDLPDPQAMFDINYFKQDPRPFYKFAREIYPGQFKPSPCHRFIKCLEKHVKLLRNYTQNIDTLEQVAGIERVIECHGSFATASCTRCKHKVSSEEIRQDILEQRIPRCVRCFPSQALQQPAASPRQEEEEQDFGDLFNQGIMKPDIVFFGEGLSDAFHHAMASDKDQCDLLIVIGSSLKVRPVAQIPSSIPAHVPQILINRERLPHLNFDVELLGDSDVIVNQLCHFLAGEWMAECWQEPLQEVDQLLEVQAAAAAAAPTQSWAMERPSQAAVERVYAAIVSRDRHLSVESMQSASDSGIAGVSGVSCSEGAGRDSRQLSTDSMHSATSDSGLGGSTQALQGPPSPRQAPSEASSHSRHMSVDSPPPPAVPAAAAAAASSSSGSSVSARQASAPQPGEEEESEDDELDSCWQPKARESLAQRLPSKSYYFQRPNRYIFPGAEVYYDPEDDSSSGSRSRASSACGDVDEDNGYWEEEEDEAARSTSGGAGPSGGPSSGSASGPEEAPSSSKH